MASAHRCPSLPKSMMQSLHVLRCALRGSLLPMHLEQRKAARSAHRNKRVSQCEASTFPRHRTRCARRCLLQLRCCTPLQLCNTLFQRLALLSDTSLVQSAIRQSLLAPFSTASKRVTIIAFFPTSRCTRIIRLAALYFTPGGRADLSPMEHVG